MRLRFDPWVRKIPLEKKMVTHFSILAWEILRIEELGQPHSMGSKKSQIWLSDKARVVGQQLVAFRPKFKLQVCFVWVKFYGCCLICSLCLNMLNQSYIQTQIKLHFLILYTYLYYYLSYRHLSFYSIYTYFMYANTGFSYYISQTKR